MFTPDDFSEEGCGVEDMGSAFTQFLILPGSLGPRVEKLAVRPGYVVQEIAQMVEQGVLTSPGIPDRAVRFSMT